MACKVGARSDRATARYRYKHKTGVLDEVTEDDPAPARIDTSDTDKIWADCLWSTGPPRESPRQNLRVPEVRLASDLP